MGLLVATANIMILAALFGGFVLLFYGALWLMAALKFTLSDWAGWWMLIGVFYTPVTLFFYWIVSTMGILARKVKPRDFVFYGIASCLVIPVAFLFVGESMLFSASSIFSIPIIAAHYFAARKVLSDYFVASDLQGLQQSASRANAGEQ